MKKTNLIALLALAATPAFLHAQTNYSDVVGYQKITLPYGGKAVAPTFIKASVFSGTATISGTTISVASGALSGLSLGPTAFSNRANYPKYYAEVTDTNSPFYGYNFDIASHTSSADSFTSENLPTQLANDGVTQVPISGSVAIEIRPHITLADLSPASLSDGDSISMANDPTGDQKVFYVYNGGWIGSDFNPNKDFSHVIIPPGFGFAYSAQNSELTLTLVGKVKNTPTAVPVYQNAYANIVAAINPSTTVDYAGQNIANGIGDGAAFTQYSSDGSFTETQVYYSANGGLVNSAFRPVSSANISGGEAVNVGALNSDMVWMVPAAIARGN